MLIKTIIAASIKILSTASAFILTFSVAHILDFEETGIFLFSLTLMGMGSVFFHLSLDNVVIREISAKNAANNRQAVLSIGQQWVLVVSLPFSAFALILFSGIAKHLLSKLEFGPVLRITALALPVMAMYMLISMGFQTLHRVILTTLFQNLGVSFNEIRQLSR